jgi:diacylglycerol kinase (ATP)
MRVMILFNPVSGAGRAAAAGRDAAEQLRAAGHVVELMPTRLASPRDWLDDALRGFDLLVVAGGDGAVRIGAASASRANSAIYHLPFGTENLFAREFGMTRDPDMLVNAIEGNQIQSIDVGLANGRTFLLMASIGFDAEVVHDLASRRGDSISHLSYIPPILAQLWRWKPPRLRVCVDDQCVVDNQTGFIVVANSRQYGWRFNPAARASMTDGVLDAAFFPTRSRAGLIRWAMRCRGQRHLHHPQFRYCTGKVITIESDVPQHYQLDGDPPGVVHEMEDRTPPADEQGLTLELSLRPKALRVLLPVDRGRRIEH